MWTSACAWPMFRRNRLSRAIPFPSTWTLLCSGWCGTRRSRFWKFRTTGRPFSLGQTALRESIGRHELHQMVAERELLGHELQRILDEKTNPWGITVQSVEIRDVQIPQELQDTMSREAQAERERRARVILSTAETEIAEKFGQASLVYQHNPVAMHLRAMNMLYEAIKEKGAMVIVPSSAVETMGLGGMLATASMGGAKPQ